MNDHIISNIEELVGKTPLYKPVRWLRAKGFANAEAFCKLEGMNVAGSVKDRAALGMIRSLEEQGRLQEGGTIIEATSGNTGISLAALAASRGYRAIFVMPETMSVERRKFMQAYGAEIVLTSGDGGMTEAIEKAVQLKDEIEGAVIPSQFDNPANPKYHEETTGPEIWKQTDGQVDVLVLGVGTGGTLTGAGRFLKKQNPDLEIIAVEPSSSAVLSGEAKGKHGIQGIGAGFVPENLDRSLVDRVLTVKTFDAIEAAREFSRREGVFVGISAGAALAGVAQVLSDERYSGKRVVTVLPDSGDRYLSTELLNV